MNEIPNPVDSRSRFPELVRAQELYRTLFDTAKPLYQLHYTREQAGYAMGALQLLHEPTTYSPEWQGCSIFTTSPTIPDSSLMIHAYFDTPGYTLHALRGTRKPLQISFIKRLQLGIGLTKKDFLCPDIPIFALKNPVVAQVILRNESEMSADDIGSVVTTAYRYWKAYSGPLGVRSGLRDAASILGLVSTYQAVWTDKDRTHLAVKLLENGGMHHHLWRKLDPLTDENGTVVPFGRCAGDHQKLVEQALNTRRAIQLSGNLAVS